MSNFKSTYPIDVKAITDLLPAKSYVDSVVWNPETKSLEVNWSNEGFKTLYSTAIDWSLEKLKDGSIPDGVKNLSIVKLPDPIPSEPAPTVPPEEKPVDKPAKRGARSLKS